MRFSRKHLAILGAMGLASAAYAATQITVQTPFALSDGISGDKPKLQRLGDGTLVSAYGDSPAGAGMVYDVKAAAERTARDAFVKTCKPDATKTCNKKTDWSAAVNVSKSALQQSTGVFDWRGTLGAPSTYPGDIDKVNIKTSGPMMMLTWVSKYCPDGDPATAGIQTSVQRAIQYPERESRVIPFSCTWTAFSSNKGSTWSAPVQLSTGERDAIQDSSGGNIGTDPANAATYNKGQIGISWQEDPQGLKLGEAEGPGDGASGSNANGGTDVWYAYATVDLSVPGTPADDFVRQPAVRLTDNLTGLGGSESVVYDGAGAIVPAGSIETGEVGASRPNIGMVGTTSIIAYEEKKNSGGLDIGKYIRYHAFPFNTPPATVADKAGCIISDPSKNARRVRFLTQSPTDAGPGGIQLGIFWKEGAYNEGGPSDLVIRRGMGGIQPANMVPAVDAACATSDYAAASALTSTRAQNISSHAPTATTANLTDGTEQQATENALAHRGVLRGRDMWVGYSYAADLAKLATQQDNYNFWIRQFNADSGTWKNPQNVTNITDKRINVREPRIFATPKSNDTLCPTDPTFCQNLNVLYLAWGTVTNAPPSDPAGAQDLGEYITVSLNSATTFATPVRLSLAQGVLYGDDESAFETQPVTRPDGTRFYTVWNQKTLATGVTVAEYTSGDIAQVADPVPPTPVAPVSSGGGGCTIVTGNAPFDPVLPLLAILGLMGLGARRLRRHPAWNGTRAERPR
jgi:hypothetical protein